MRASCPNSGEYGTQHPNMYICATVKSHHAHTVAGEHKRYMLKNSAHAKRELYICAKFYFKIAKLYILLVYHMWKMVSLLGLELVNEEWKKKLRCDGAKTHSIVDIRIGRKLE